MSNLRREFCALVLNQMKTFYRWGGKEPGTGLDCSGLVTWALWRAGGPDWRQTHNTDKLWNELSVPQMLRPGDLAFYGGKGLPEGGREPKDVSHVMIWLFDPGGGSGGLVVGASGGDSTTIDAVAATKQGAYVKCHRTHLYRDDFRAFRTLPLGE